MQGIFYNITGPWSAWNLTCGGIGWEYKCVDDRWVAWRLDGGSGRHAYTHPNVLHCSPLSRPPRVRRNPYVNTITNTLFLSSATLLWDVTHNTTLQVRDARQRERCGPYSWCPAAVLSRMVFVLVFPPFAAAGQLHVPRLGAGGAGLVHRHAAVDAVQRAHHRRTGHAGLLCVRGGAWRRATDGCDEVSQHGAPEALIPLISPPTFRRRHRPAAKTTGAYWTYNQGVILSGLTRYAAIFNEPSRLADAATLAKTAVQYYGASTPRGDVLVETACGAEGMCGGLDVQQFKGVFVRHLAYALPVRAGARGRG